MTKVKISTMLHFKIRRKIIDHGNGLIEWMYYYINGNLWQRLTRLNNKSYDTLYVHFIELNGKRHGEYKLYNFNGKLMIHSYNIKDELEGERLEYIYD